MEVFILEDEAPAARRLERLLAEVVPHAEVVGVVPSVQEALSWVIVNRPPDLILADIELADGRCFDFFSKHPPRCPVIFITAYDAFALQAFDHNGIAYLLKPIEDTQLKKAFDKLEVLSGSTNAKTTILQQGALDKLLAQLALQSGGVRSYRERFLLKFGDKYVPLEMRDVAYLYASEKVVYAQTLEGRTFPLDETLDELEGQLDVNRFFRINRSVLATRTSIRNIVAHFNGRLKLSLAPELSQEVYVSRERATAFRSWMNH